MHDSILAIAGTIDLTMGGQARPDRQRGLRHPPRGLRVHRPAQPGGDPDAVQLPEPERADGQALPHPGAPAAALPDEQPAGDRDGAQADAQPGVPLPDDGRAARRRRSTSPSSSAPRRPRRRRSACATSSRTRAAPRPRARRRPRSPRRRPRSRSARPSMALDASSRT